MKRLLILLLFSFNFVSGVYVKRDPVVIVRLRNWISFVRAGSNKEQKQIWDIVYHCLILCLSQKGHTPEVSKTISNYLDTLNNEYSVEAKKFLQHYKIV